jgi:hypothetical protein
MSLALEACALGKGQSFISSVHKMKRRQKFSTLLRDVQQDGKHLKCIRIHIEVESLWLNSLHEMIEPKSTQMDLKIIIIIASIHKNVFHMWLQLFSRIDQTSLLLFPGTSSPCFNVYMPPQNGPLPLLCIDMVRVFRTELVTLYWKHHWFSLPCSQSTLREDISSFIHSFILFTFRWSKYRCNNTIGYRTCQDHMLRHSAVHVE